jgi:hypothetical protein
MEKERVNHYTKRLWNAKHTTEIRAILKEFEFECASQNSSTSDEALPIGDVVLSEERAELVCDECKEVKKLEYCVDCYNEACGAM